MDIQISTICSVDSLALVTGTRSEWWKCIRQLVAARACIRIHYVIHTITIGDKSWSSELDAMLGLMSVDDRRQLFDKLKGRWFGHWSLPVLVKYNLNVNSLNVCNKSDELIAALSSLGFVHAPASGRVARSPRYRWRRLRQRRLLLSIVRYWSHVATMPDSKVATKLITKYESTNYFTYKPKSIYQQAVHFQLLTMSVPVFNAVVAIIREYSTRQAERAWNLPFTVIDTLDRDNVRRTHEPTVCDHVFNDIILFFEKVDAAVVKHNECYDANFAAIVDANTMVTNQEIVHKRLYDGFARWWRQVRPDGIVDGDFTIATEPAVDNSLAGFLLVNFLLERCALPLVFDVMQRIKPSMEALYGARAVDVYNANDEVISDETDHGRQYAECWELVKDEISGERFQEVRGFIWDIIEPIFNKYGKIDEYFMKFIDLSNGEDVQLIYMADSQSVRPFEGSRIGYINTDFSDSVANLAKNCNALVRILKRECDDDTIDAKRPRLD